jgi:hypothetical protein
MVYQERGSTSRKPHIHDHFPVTIYVLVIEVVFSDDLHNLVTDEVLRCQATKE